MQERKPHTQLMNPKVDFVFKSIFGNVEHPAILISFLNGVLETTEENKIISVEIENPAIEKMDIEDKYSILDIKATANNNTKLDIEIQIKNNYDMIPRTIYYLSKLVEGQMSEGDSYTKILRTITINLLDFTLLKENKRVHNTFVYKEKTTNEVLTELTEIHFIEFPKLKKTTNKKTLLHDWLLFMENPDSKEVDMLARKIPEIEEAKSSLAVLSLDKKAKALYESRQKSLFDKVSALESAEKKGIEKGLKEGLEKGLEKGRIEIAKRCIMQGLPNSVISTLTELSEDTIEKIRKGLER